MATRILVIEDNPANMELARYVLEAFGYAVSAATDGENGVEQALADPPDLVICDLQLPGIDGIEVAKRLKAHPVFARVPLVALTAYAMVGDRERVLAAGFDGYIAKPIDPQVFVPQIAAYLKSPPPTPRHLDMSAAAPGRLSAAVRAKALVLDDTPANSEFLRSLLEPHGIKVDAVSTIDAALAHLAANVPDVIISDIHLHNERGETFYAAVRARPALGAVPFIFISSTVIRNIERLSVLATGADRFILRPIENARLLAEIEACLALRKAS